jgi:iron complex transport system substrate-binding protein
MTSVAATPAGAAGATDVHARPRPQRIVSLLPSATEIAFALGLGERVVGVTFECDAPAQARDGRTVVLGTLDLAGATPAQIDAAVKLAMAQGRDLYRLDEGALAGLDPDLVLTQDLCRVCAVPTSSVDEAMARLGCDATVLTLDPHTLDEVLASIRAVGAATGATEEAADLVAILRMRLASLRHRLAGHGRRTVALLEWPDPVFAPGHWVPEIVYAAGGLELLGTTGKPSVQVGMDKVHALAPEVVVVAPCGFDLERSVAAALDVLPTLPADAEVWAIDASAYVARPGPRLVEGAEAIAWALHPDAVPEPPAGRIARVR